MTERYLDKEVFDAIELEKQRQEENIELIASENFVFSGGHGGAGQCADE